MLASFSFSGNVPLLVCLCHVRDALTFSGAGSRGETVHELLLGLLALKKESIRLWLFPSSKLGRRLRAILFTGSDGTPLKE